MYMSLSNFVNSSGLFLDIVGVVLIWRYGLPEPISRTGATYIITEQIDQTEMAKAANYDLLSKLGLGLIITGFLMQIVSNFITN